nr:sigma-70 family RNA polymerase sigma factor [Glycomyces albidus]
MFDEHLLRDLTPQVLGILIRRGADFAAAEDAVQDALVETVRRWDGDAPADPKGWLVTVAWRRFLDARRSASARAAREENAVREPAPGPAEQADDTLLLLSRCCHPSLTPASAIALTLRAVGGLTTAQIARAFLVPESTMAQRISRAKKTLAGERFEQPGDVRAVLRVLYLMFDQGFAGERGPGDADLAAEAIRLTRQLAASVPGDPEAAGLLALMLLHHARRGARTDASGDLVPLALQDRSQWDTAMIAEGVELLQGALVRDRLGEYQAQAAIAALHDDAASAGETDWPQILEWYDELVRLSPGNPVVALNRAVAVGHVDGPLAGLRLVEALDPGLPRRDAVAAYLHERAGNTGEAARLYAAAARSAPSSAEMSHLLKQAARLNRARSGGLAEVAGVVGGPLLERAGGPAGDGLGGGAPGDRLSGGEHVEQGRGQEPLGDLARQLLDRDVAADRRADELDLAALRQVPGAVHEVLPPFVAAPEEGSDRHVRDVALVDRVHRRVRVGDAHDALLLDRVGPPQRVGGEHGRAHERPRQVRRLERALDREVHAADRVLVRARVGGGRRGQQDDVLDAARLRRGDEVLDAFVGGVQEDLLHAFQGGGEGLGGGEVDVGGERPARQFDRRGVAAGGADGDAREDELRDDVARDGSSRAGDQYGHGWSPSGWCSGAAASRARMRDRVSP